MSEHTVFCHSLKAVMTAAVLVFAAAEAVADELPEGYVRLGYVGFTGEQYVDTLVTPTSTDFGFDLDFVCESQLSSAVAKHILGSSKMNSGEWGGISLSTWTATLGGQMTFCKDNTWINPWLTPGTRQQLSLRNQRYLASNGGAEQNVSSHSTTSLFCGNLYLGAIHHDQGTGVTSTGFFSGRVYRLTLYKATTVIADYVPVVSPAGVAGFYDVAGENGFIASATDVPLVPSAREIESGCLEVSSSNPGIVGFSPANTEYSGLKVGSRVVIRARGEVTDENGERYICTGWELYDHFGLLIDSCASRKFAYRHQNAEDGRRVVWQWRKVAELPDGYTPVEFVASDGNQFVDTGITPDATTRVVCELRYPRNGITLDREVSMGWGNNDGDTFFWGYRTKYKGYFSFSVYGIWNGSWNVVNTGVRVDSARHVFDLGPGAQKLDGVTYATGYPGEVMQNNLKNGAVPHIMLFGTSVGWASDINYFAPSVEIYAVKIYQQGELVADLCPAICPAKLDDPDGVGFYDLKRKEFFTGRMSSITGSKTRLRNGEVVSTEVLPAPPGLIVIFQGSKTLGKGD